MIFAANIIISRFCVRNALVSLSITTEASKDLKHTNIFCRTESRFPAQQHRYQTLTVVSAFASASQCFWIFSWFGYGSIPINTIFRGMNIHLPAILMFTRGTRFWHTAISVSPGQNADPLRYWRTNCWHQYLEAFSKSRCHGLRSWIVDHSCNKKIKTYKNQLNLTWNPTSGAFHKWGYP